MSCSSRCDPQTNSLKFTWELLRKAGPQAPPQTSWPGTCMLKSSQGTSMPGSLRSPGLGPGLQPRKDTGFTWEAVQAADAQGLHPVLIERVGGRLGARVS